MLHTIERLTVVLAVAMIAAGAWAADTSLVAEGARQWEAGRLVDAQTSFEQAIIADPRSIEAHMRLGGLLLSTNNLAPAIQTYQRVISLDGNNAKAWIGLGMAYLHSGQRELSRAAFTEAIRIEPGRKAQLATLAEVRGQ